MAIDVQVRGFSGVWAALNAPTTVHEVGLAEVVNKAITVGGFVHGSAAERSRRRTAISELALSSVRAVGPPRSSSELVTTDLYRHTEMSEKTGISYRLGMAFAAVVAGCVLRTKVVKHVRVRVSATERRADLVGLDPMKRPHVVEAKCRTHGLTPKLRREAKDQASATAAALSLAGTRVETTSACLTDLSEARIRVLLEDPPPSDDAAPVDLDVAAFLHDYYAPVRDLLQVRDAERSGHDDVDAFATGSWLSGGDVWLGLPDQVLEQVSVAADEIDSVVELQVPFIDDDWLVSAAADGHVVVLGPRALRFADEVTE